MSDVRVLSQEEIRKFWAHVEKNAKEVEGWPEWKRGGLAIAVPEASREDLAGCLTRETAEDPRR